MGVEGRIPFGMRRIDLVRYALEYRSSPCGAVEIAFCGAGVQHHDAGVFRVVCGEVSGEGSLIAAVSLLVLISAVYSDPRGAGLAGYGVASTTPRRAFLTAARVPDEQMEPLTVEDPEISVGMPSRSKSSIK